MKHHFSEHVKAMHEKRDSGFEKEFQVCLCATTDVTRVSYIPPKLYQFNPLEYIHMSPYFADHCNCS